MMEQAAVPVVLSGQSADLPVMSGNIVVPDGIHAHVVAPVPAEGGGLFCLLAGDPEFVEFLLPPVVGNVIAAFGAEFLDFLHVPDPLDQFLIGILRRAHYLASFP